MFFVNQRLRVTSHELATPEEFAVQTPQVRGEVRNGLLANLDLIQTFTAENPARLPEEELDIVRSWRHLIFGSFCILRHLKNYTVFLSATNPVIAYGVLALTQPLEDLIGPHLPVVIQTVLLPFKKRIIYDGLLAPYRISMGPGIRRRLNEDFKKAKERFGIVTSLPMSQEPPPPKPAKTKAAPKLLSNEDKDESLHIVLGLIDQFCKEHLNEEYAVLCRKLAEKLGHKRPSPLVRGSPNAWASAIVRAIGGVNFLHDKTQMPYVRSNDIDEYFGISPSSGATKLAAIRKMFRMGPLEPDWCLPSRLADNPLVWMLRSMGW